MDFYDLTLDEQIRCIEVMRQKDMEKVLDSTYNPIQIRLNRKAINMYYDGLIKELKQNNITNEAEKEELSKVA